MSMSRIISAVAVMTACWTEQSQAVVITFTGGTVTRLDSSTETTNNAIAWDNVDFYEVDGFRLDFIPNLGSGSFATQIGDYYGVGNDVIHAHWATGSFGGVTSIEITKVGGGTFDLNYFVLTSNTDTGGGPASGNEQAFIEGFNSNVSTGAPLQLPSEDWGFPAAQLFLGSSFDSVDKVVFSVANVVDCFGMDEFYIDQPAPGTDGVPEASSLAIWSLLAAVVAVWHRRCKVVGHHAPPDGPCTKNSHFRAHRAKK
jgi:hypothetical protein